MARIVPATVELDGFDISDSGFGAKEWLPKNVTLTSAFDATSKEPLPKNLQAKYDVVHIRAFASIIKNNNVEPLIANLLGMLSRWYGP